MDEDIKPKQYHCPVCDEDKPAIYVHPLGDKVLLPGNVYIIGMCLECVRERDPFYAIRARGRK